MTFTPLLPRIALYSIISGIEEDLRLAITRGLDGVDAEEVLGSALRERAAERAEQDLGAAPVETAELLPYVDFGDAWQLVARHSERLPPAWSSATKKRAREIDRLNAIRKRVMHTRPLDFDDLPLAMEFARQLADNGELDTPRLAEALTLLRENPAVLLDRGLPAPQTNENHNLPFPDFDETGFVGRRQVIERVKDLCLGPYPVITIVGDGGLGKTAAAVKVAYELLDDERSPFDAIVWSSSKTTQLTARDIKTIEGAISDSLGLMEAIATDLGASDPNEPVEEVLAYLAEFRILLVLDNLETVLDDRIRRFLERLPVGSKILITSRIGLGPYEHPVKLPKLDGDEAVQLIRALAHVRGVTDLVGMDNKKVARYCHRMNNNPLWIKWFVSGVQAGVRPEELLARPDQFLEFSMSNVFDYLSDCSRRVLQMMQVVPGKKSQPEVVFLTGETGDAIHDAMAELCATNMVTMASTPIGSSYETHYELAELARTYLAKRHPVDRRVHSALTAKHRQLRAAGEELREAQKIDPYRLRSLDLRSAGNLIVAKHLLNALDAAKKNEFVRAEEEIGKARQLAPEWYEVPRVEALVKANEGNLTAAQHAFEAALELEPASAPLRLRYGMFKLDHLDDPSGAIGELSRAVEIDPKALNCRLELVRAHQRNLEFEFARRELDELAAGSARLSPLKLRMLHDLELQQWMRLADHLSVAGDNDRAAKALESMRKAYVQCPSKVRDPKIRGRLAQALPTARRVYRFSRDPELKTQTRQFIEWVTRGMPDSNGSTPSVGQQALGTVTKLVHERGFGFARMSDGESVFLHFSDLEFDEAQLEIGTEIVFELAEGRDGGLRAIKAVRA